MTALLERNMALASLCANLRVESRETTLCAAARTPGVEGAEGAGGAAPPPPGAAGAAAGEMRRRLRRQRHALLSVRHGARGGLDPSPAAAALQARARAALARAALQARGRSGAP
jgi:hypothetical protein